MKVPASKKTPAGGYTNTHIHTYAHTSVRAVGREVSRLSKPYAPAMRTDDDVGRGRRVLFQTLIVVYHGPTIRSNPALSDVYTGTPHRQKAARSVIFDPVLTQTLDAFITWRRCVCVFV